MNIDKAYITLSKYYKTEPNKIKYILDIIFKDNNNNNKDIILPFNGSICKNKCRAVVYNHGLYTQCMNDSEDICKHCLYTTKDNNFKYGLIENRAKYPIGTFEYNGKKEIPYNDFIKKMNYNTDDVIRALRNAKINYDINNIVKKRRGRPKKDTLNDETEIEVTEYHKDGIIYMLTADNILLYNGNFIGILSDDKIIQLDI